jgi:undecaprenyl-diphosphatase
MDKKYGLLILLLLATPCTAMTDSYIRTFSSGTAAGGTAPARERTFITKNLEHLDETITLKINSFSGRSKPLDFIMIAFSLLGGGTVIVLVSGLALFFIDRKKFFPNFLVFLAVLTVGSLMIQVLKSLYNLPRPLKSFPDLRILLSPLLERGFPSGHTFAVFTAAAYLSDRLKGAYRNFSWLLYSLAALGGISRMYVGAHYFSDVMAGAIIGLIYTFLALYLIKRRFFVKNRKTSPPPA